MAVGEQRSPSIGDSAPPLTNTQSLNIAASATDLLSGRHSVKFYSSYQKDLITSWIIKSQSHDPTNSVISITSISDLFKSSVSKSYQNYLSTSRISKSPSQNPINSVVGITSIGDFFKASVSESYQNYLSTSRISKSPSQNPINSVVGITSIGDFFQSIC